MQHVVGLEQGDELLAVAYRRVQLAHRVAALEVARRRVDDHRMRARDVALDLRDEDEIVEVEEDAHAGERRLQPLLDEA